jgi:hypothetical protein
MSDVHIEPGDPQSEPGLWRVTVSLLLNREECNQYAATLDQWGWIYEAEEIREYFGEAVTP